MSSHLINNPLGDLERLRRYWFQGACKSQKNKRNISKPLDVNQFMSAFLLLGCGILLTVVLLALEHLYFRYCRHCLARTEKDACFTLVSLVRICPLMIATLFDILKLFDRAWPDHFVLSSMTTTEIRTFARTTSARFVVVVR